VKGRAPKDRTIVELNETLTATGWVHNANSYEGSVTSGMNTLALYVKHGQL